MKHLLKKLILAISLLLINFSISAQTLPGSGTTLDFDGTDEYVEFTKTTDMNFGSTQDFTIEFWLKAPTNWGGDPPLISDKDWAHGINKGWNIALASNGKTINVNISDGSNKTYLKNKGIINDDSWHHIAVCFDRSANVTLYIDGIGTDSTSIANISDIDNSLNKMCIHQDGTATYQKKSTAKMDEIRIWNDIRTQTEIRDYMCQKLVGNEANLIHYYRLDDATGTSLIDATGSMNGSIINMDNSDWVPSGAPIGDVSNYQYSGTPSVNLAHADGDNFTINAFTGSPTAAYLYLINESPNFTSNNLSSGIETTRYWGTFIVGGTSPTYTAIYNYTGNSIMEADEANGRLAKRFSNSIYFWNLASTASDLDINSDQITISGQSGRSEYIGGFGNAINFSLPGSGMTLDFDGTDEYVEFTKTTDMNFGSAQDFTIEFWLKAPTNWVGDPPLISDKDWQHGYNKGWNIALSKTVGMIDVNVGDGTKRADLDEGSINDDTWHHIAVCFDRDANVTLYIDGIETGSTPITNLSDVNNSLKMCIHQDGTAAYQKKSTAKMDEIRIWNDIRTQTEIRDYMCQKLVGNEANLIHYYRLDDATGTSLEDATGSMNGSIINMDNSDWVLSGAPIGDASVHVYTVSTATPDLNIAHANGDDMTIDFTAGTATSFHLYRVDEKPNNTTPPGTQVKLSTVTYYGAKAFGANGLTYSAIYNYDGHPAITNETTLELAKRDNNSDITWSQESATLNTTANTLTLTGQTGTEYILADGPGGENPLPIELLSFTAKLTSNRNVQLDWQTATEMNNDYFTVERSINGNDWEIIRKINGAGNSSVLLNYSTNDNDPYLGISYYRLKQTDFDGEYSYSSIISINIDNINNHITIYPNPTTNHIIILGEDSELNEFRIFNTVGQDITDYSVLLEKSKNRLLIDLSSLDSGLYYIKTKTIVKKVYKL